MNKALERLRTQVLGLAEKYSHGGKRKELEQAFSVLAQEFEHQQVQSQRIMVLLRAIINNQPGSAKAVNEFLQSPAVAKAMQSGGAYTMK